MIATKWRLLATCLACIVVVGCMSLLFLPSPILIYAVGILSGWLFIGRPNDFWWSEMSSAVFDEMDDLRIQNLELKEQILALLRIWPSDRQDHRGIPP